MGEKRKKALWWIVVWGFVLLQAGTAWAHKVYIFAWVEGNRVYTDSYFPDKRKVVNGSVKVFDPAGRKLVEGKTDKQGAFSFNVPQKSDLKIVLEATMGHRAVFTLKAEELSGNDPEAIPGPTIHETVITTPGAKNADLDAVERAVQRALEKKLGPIEKKLARLEEEKGPGFTEVVGGIGYIIGLMGIVAYFRGRRAR
jgi:nickel transport protein